MLIALLLLLLWFWYGILCTGYGGCSALLCSARCVRSIVSGLYSGPSIRLSINRQAMAYTGGGNGLLCLAVDHLSIAICLIRPHYPGMTKYHTNRVYIPCAARVHYNRVH